MTAVLDLGTGLTEAIERAVADAVVALGANGTVAPDDPIRWRTLLWSGDAALRVTVRELAAGLGMSRQTVYRLVEQGMPARRRHGALVFVLGEVRRWLERSEEMVPPALARPPRLPQSD